MFVLVPPRTIVNDHESSAVCLSTPWEMLLLGGSLGYKGMPTEGVIQTLDLPLTLPQLSYVTLCKWLTSLSLNFLSCQMGMIRVSTSWDHEKIC